MEQNNAEEEQTATVSEGKFNGTATLSVRVPEGTEQGTVESLARQYFRDTHGTSPSKVVSDKSSDSMFSDTHETWDVMAADHSSGSMVDGEEYEL